MAIPKTTSEIMYELIFMTKRCVIWHLMVFRPSLFFYGFGNSGSTLHNNTLSNACIVEGVACECEKHKTEWVMSPSSKQLQNFSNCFLILPVCTLVSFWWHHVCALCVISGLSKYIMLALNHLYPFHTTQKSTSEFNTYEYNDINHNYSPDYKL